MAQKEPFKKYFAKKSYNINKKSFFLWPGRIIPFLKGVAFSFSSGAERKNIHLSIHFPVTKSLISFDADLLEKIVSNLISNVLKFTPEEGRVEVHISLLPPSLHETGKSQWLEIVVKGSGIGIPEEPISKLFDLFYQVDSSNTREKEGTGIRLALTKELIVLHGGSIRGSADKKEEVTKLLLLFELLHEAMHISNTPMLYYLSI